MIDKVNTNENFNLMGFFPVPDSSSYPFNIVNTDFTKTFKDSKSFDIEFPMENHRNSNSLIKAINIIMKKLVRWAKLIEKAYPMYEIYDTQTFIRPKFLPNKLGCMGAKIMIRKKNVRENA